MALIRNAASLVTTHANITTEVYQAKLHHKKFPDPLKCVLKTHLPTEKQSHVLLFSSDLALDAETLIDSSWSETRIVLGLEDFMNEQDSREQRRESFYVHGQCVCETFSLRAEHSEGSVLDLKARKYLHETLKILPQKLNILDPSVLFITLHLKSDPDNWRRYCHTSLIISFTICYYIFSERQWRIQVVVIGGIVYDQPTRDSGYL